MPTLHVRSVPEDLYERVQKLAQLRSRSLSAQVVEMLYDALEEEAHRSEQGKALGALRRRLMCPTATAYCTRIASVECFAGRLRGRCQRGDQTVRGRAALRPVASDPLGCRAG